jgi:hypothetical protein
LEIFEQQALIDEYIDSEENRDKIFGIAKWKDNKYRFGALSLF